MLIKDKNNGYVVLSKIEYFYLIDLGQDWKHPWIVMARCGSHDYELREFDTESMCHIWINKHLKAWFNDLKSKASPELQ